MSVHILWGLFMLISGSETFLLTLHVVPLIAVAVPGLVLPAVFSNCVSIQISPTAGTVGFDKGVKVMF